MRVPVHKVSAFLAISIGILAIASIASSAYALNCPAANPNDQIADDDALQACLNNGGTISLAPGNPGYVLKKGIWITRSGTVLTSAAIPQKATLFAESDLASPMLSANLDNFTLEYLTFNGNRDNRHPADQCGGNGTSSIVSGYGITLGASSNFTVHDVAILNTTCGSAFHIHIGTNFEIYSSNVSGSGSVARMADGLTIGKCDQGYIHDNTFEDNTDVSIIPGGGNHCRILNNVIRQKAAQGSAGMWIENFPCCGLGNHSDSIYAYNTITSEIPNGLGAGMVVGAHVTSPELDVSNAGSIIGNTISGAGVNLLVDGVSGGTIYNNVLSNPQGKAGSYAFGNNCSQNENYNYAVAHTTGTLLQPGWVNRAFDSWMCQRPNEAITSLKNDAQFIGQSAPMSIAAGQTAQVSMTFKNTGTTAWNSQSGGANHKLGSQNPQDNVVWGAGRINLMQDDIIMPGQTKTFTFTVTAPSNPGTYDFQWRMVQEGVEWFGEASPNVRISVTAPPDTGKLWFGPNTVASNDFKELFTKPDMWKAGRSSVSVFKLYDLMLNPQWESNWIGPWGHPEDAYKFMNDSELADAIAKLRAWGIETDFESGAVKAWGCTGDVTFGQTNISLYRIKSLGGSVKYISMDEPFIGGTVAAPQGCGYGMDKTIDETINYISRVKADYPGIVIGDIEPWPYFSKDQLKQWIAGFKQKAGYELPFLHMDVNYALARAQNNNMQDIKDLADFCRARGIRFGIIMWQSNYNSPLDSDKRFYDNTMAWASIANSLGPTDEAIVQTWDAYPKLNLPETSGYSFTQLLKDYADKYPPTIKPKLASDTNKDGFVNSADFTMLKSSWLSASGASDINQDGIVNSADFGMMMSQWNA